MTEKTHVVWKKYFERTGILDKIRDLREKKRMKISMIARELGLSESTVRAYLKDMGIV